MVVETYISIIYSKCEWIKISNQKREAGKMDTETYPSICCLQEIHFKPRDTYRLRVRGCVKIFHAIGNQKKVGEAI